MTTLTHAHRKLGVLHVGKFYPPVSGGMEKVLQVVCEGEREHVESRVLVANDCPATAHETVNGVAVTRVGAIRRVGAVAVCPAFPYWMRRLQTDVMVIHEPNPLALAAHALVGPRSKLLVWIHAEVVRPQWQYKAFYRPFLRRVLRRADRIVVATPPILEHAQELQDFRHKCVVVPYAIDPDGHALTARNHYLVDEIRRERPEPLVLFVGRMVPYKGVDVLIRALVGTSARAVLVGDGPQRLAWEQLAHDLGVSDRVRFTGEATDIALGALYQACDMLVLPSVTRAEAFGMVQLEAMAAGKPVVCTSLPSGVPWVNTDGETGLVVPPGDVSALRTAIDTLARSEALRRQMGARGRARVLAHFTIDRLVEQTTGLYRSVVEAPIALADPAVAKTIGAS